MTYIVNDNCIACKYTDCVEVCPGGLFLRRREHAGDPPRRMHRLRRVRARMPGRCDPARHRAGHGEMGRVQPQILRDCGRSSSPRRIRSPTPKSATAKARQAGEVFLRSTGRRRLTIPVRAGLAAEYRAALRESRRCSHVQKINALLTARAFRNPIFFVMLCYTNETYDPDYSTCSAARLDGVVF